MHIDLAVAPGCSSDLQTKLACAAQPDGTEIGSVAQVVVASVGEQSGSPVTARGGRESGHRVGPADGARYVVGVVLEAVERHWADVALALRPVVGPRSVPGRARNKKCLVGPYWIAACWWHQTADWAIVANESVRVLETVGRLMPEGNYRREARQAGLSDRNRPWLISLFEQPIIVTGGGYTDGQHRSCALRLSGAPRVAVVTGYDMLSPE